MWYNFSNLSLYRTKVQEDTMMDYRLHTPEGVKDYLPKEYMLKRKTQNNIEKIFSSFNYKPVESPTFEYIEVYEGKGSVDTKTMYKFVDRDGSVLALRPDVTPAIGRIATTSYNSNDIPMRFAYVGNAFRYNEHYQGKLREFTQAGIELIGVSGVEADAEVLTVAIESLLSAGLKDFRIDIGNVLFLQGVLEEAGISHKLCEKIQDSIVNKNYVQVSSLIENTHIKPEHKRIFKELPLLIGGIEIIDTVKNMVNNEKSLNAIKHLQQIYEILDLNGLSKYISFDFSVIGHFDYYTSLIFRGYARGTGFSVIDGGRYDKLIADYPAVGFGIKIIDLMAAVEYQSDFGAEKNNAVVVAFAENSRENAYKLAAALRKKGVVVENSLCGYSIDDNKEYVNKKGHTALYYVENDKVSVFENNDKKVLGFNELLGKEA